MSIILALGAAFPQVPPGDAEGRIDGCSRLKAARAHHPDTNRLRLKSSSDPLTTQTDVQHYRLELEIDPATEYLTGINTMTVTAAADDVSRFRFWLHTALSVTAVELDGDAVDWLRLDSEAIEVDLGRSFMRGQTFDLRVSYEGNPEAAGWMSILFDSHHGTPVVSTLSQPWYAYTWWPVKEDSRDKATGELLITVPDELTVVANGVLVDVDALAGSRRRFHWSTNYPMSPYLFAFSATVYNTFSDHYVHAQGSMPVEFFVYPESDSATNRSRWRLSLDMLATFGDLFGIYPFISEKYAIYEFPFGGGMEHQTATGQGGFWEYLTAHELAHQWWGDMVTCATWSDIWLNEGFATYAEALWYEHRSGTPDPVALRAAMAERRPRRFDDSVYVHDPSYVSRIFSSDYSYRKGAWVLHMLRHVIGDQAFFDALEAYREGFQYRTATTEDFRAVVEDVSGGDLRWFFNRWVYNGGAPAYRYGWREQLVDGQRYLELSLEQSQTESVFVMPLTVETLELGERYQHTVWNNKRQQHFLIPVTAPVDEVRLDPESRVLARSKTEVAFVGGPPRVVAVDPAPGSILPAGSRMEVSVTFDEDVVADASHFRLLRSDGSEIGLAMGYDPGTFTVHLLSDEVLGPGRFELRVDDAIVGAADGTSLDGEIGALPGADALPSGDGAAGGDAVIEYETIVTRRPSGRHTSARAKELSNGLP